ncbi:MAG: phosphoglycerate kinase [Candidatus Aegiribacteria sp.]|nr:phosphoglycerate kinase [Candidatus Aegiribacteria sp.]
MKYPLLKDAKPEGKKVFLRADLNVPLEEGRVADDTRIRGVLPTMRYLLDKGAALVVASHLGRPGGSSDPSLSLAPVAERLQELLGRRVIFAPDCIGARVKTLASSLEPGTVLLLENLRFHSEEKEGDGEFAAELADLADVYVNDAFGTSHRDHASMTGIPRVLGGGFAGLLVQKELEVFGEMLGDPRHPFTLLLGGAKVSDKIPVIDNLISKLDNILIGGGMAFTFMKRAGMEIGKSLLEQDRLDAAGSIMSHAGEMDVKVLLPVDVVVAPDMDSPEQAKTVPADSIPTGMAGLDIGPKTVSRFADVVRNSSTVVWNGPMGVFEVPPFDEGTRGVAQAMAEAADNKVTTVVGGGDSVRAVTEAGLENRITFVSTGGGASLKLLQGEELVALKALRGGLE